MCTATTLQKEPLTHCVGLYFTPRRANKQTFPGHDDMHCRGVVVVVAVDGDVVVVPVPMKTSWPTTTTTDERIPRAKANNISGVHRCAARNTYRLGGG